MRSFRGGLGNGAGGGLFAFQDIIMSVTGVLIVISLMLALQLDEVSAPRRPSGISQDADPVGAGRVALELLLGDLAKAQSQLEMLQAGKRSEGDSSAVEAEIARNEDAIMRLKGRDQASAGDYSGDPITPELRVKIADIERLTQETARVEARLAKLESESAGDAGKLLELEKQVRETESMVAQSRMEKRKLRLSPEQSETTKEPVILVLSGKNFTIMEFDNPETKVLAGLTELERALARFRKVDQYFVLFVRPSGSSNFEAARNLIRIAGFEVGYDAVDETTELIFDARDNK